MLIKRQIFIPTTQRQPFQRLAATAIFIFVASFILQGCIIDAQWRPPVDTALSAQKLHLGKIEPSKKWLLNCDVYFYVISGIRTDCSYAVLTIVPKHSLIKGDQEDEGYYFILTGFRDGSVRPFHLDAKQIFTSSDAPRTFILDFLTYPLATNTRDATIILQ